MHRIRIVTARFLADTYNQGPTVRREFIPETWLVLLRHDPADQCTFFALVSDIPENQLDPPQRLPEYLIDTETFERCTRTATA